MTDNAVVRTTALETVNGTTVPGTATEYTAGGRGDGSIGLTLTSFEGLVRYPRGPASSGPLNKSITEETVNRDASRSTLPTSLARLLAGGGTSVLVDMEDDTFDLSVAAPPHLPRQSRHSLSNF